LTNVTFVPTATEMHEGPNLKSAIVTFVVEPVIVVQDDPGPAAPPEWLAEAPPDLDEPQPTSALASAMATVLTVKNRTRVVVTASALSLLRPTR
jgi:hypothetical protein